MPETNAATPIQTTAAKRLRDLLISIRNHNGPNLYSTVPDILGIRRHGSTSSQVSAWDSLRAQRLIADMIDDFGRELHEARFTEEEQSFYSQGLVGVLEALSPLNLAAHAPDAKRKITDVDIKHLEHVHLVVKGRLLEKDLEPADLVAMQDAVEAALEVARKSNLEPALLDFILSQLLRIKSAIEQYRYRGISGIREALAGYAGSLDLAKENIDDNLNETEKLTMKNVFQTGQSLLSFVNTVITAFPHILPAARVVGGFLGF